MKKTKNILLILAVVSSQLLAQVRFYPIVPKQYKTIKANTLYGVLTGDTAFDNTLQKSLKSYWKLGPVEFMDKNTLYQKRGGKEKFGFIDVGYSRKDDYHQCNFEINLNPDPGMVVASAPLDYGRNDETKPPAIYGADTSYKAMAYKIPLLIKQFQLNCAQMYEGQSKSKQTISEILASKTLLVDKILFKDYDKSILTIYCKSKIQEASSEELKNIVLDDNKSGNYVILLLSRTPFDFIAMLVDAKTGEELAKSHKPAPRKFQKPGPEYFERAVKELFK